MHFICFHSVLKDICIFTEQGWEAAQPKGEKEVHIVEVAYRTIWMLKVQGWAYERPILASDEDMLEGIGQV